MRVRLMFPPFVPLEVDVDGGCMFEKTFILKDDQRFDFTWKATGMDGDVLVAHLVSIEETMPPITPQASGYGPDTRLRMPDEGEGSFAAEAAQRRREWAALKP